MIHNITVESVLEELKNFHFEKRATFYKLPLVTLEFAQKAFCSNPYVKKFNFEINFTNILFEKENQLESWYDPTQIKKIYDTAIIYKIIKPLSKRELQKITIIKNFLKDNSGIYNSKEIEFFIDTLNSISFNMGRSKVFFDIEAFDTDDRELQNVLQKQRFEWAHIVGAILLPAYKKCLQLIHTEYEVSLSILKNVTTKEIKGILNKTYKKNDLQMFRQRPFVLVIYNGKYFLFLGKIKVDQIKNFLYGKEKKDILSYAVKGQVAYPGKVRGQALVLKASDYPQASQITKGKKDYILITSMTRPESMNALQYAKAIVTDEGGITCHAAIVSREMKKPCIVGTKHATIVFHSGDLVEVDGYKGTVKKYNK